MARIVAVLCAFSFAILGVNGSNGTVVTYIFEPLVSIIESDRMPESMKLEAVQVLRKALYEDTENPCRALRNFFMEKYAQYLWNCVEYKSYAIYRDISIDLRADDIKYTLFGLAIRKLIR